jgi:hypothetical protein
LQKEIIASFGQKYQFVYKLLDCAFGYDTEEGLGRESPHITVNLKLISYNTAVFVFGRFPLLFESLLNDYSLVDMFRMARGHKVTELLSVVGKIYNKSV